MIQGRVQGVGFRYFVLRQATSLRLNGWVRNLPNGDVEAEAEGDRMSLESLVAAARRGPRSSEVTNVVESWSESAPRYTSFATQ